MHSMPPFTGEQLTARPSRHHAQNHPRTRTRSSDHRGRHLPIHWAGPLSVGWTTWWLWRGDRTRSHPELGRENPQRPWYCASRHGRVGRRQVLQPSDKPPITHTHAGWSSPVARQAHNLKAAGSNPAPATTFTERKNKSRPQSLAPDAPSRPSASSTIAAI